MNNIGTSYSQVIKPEAYNQIVTNEHIYMAVADRYLYKQMKVLAKPFAEVVELGCGPARVLPLINTIKNINLTGVDLDIQFLKYAENIMRNSNVQIVSADVETYKHQKEVDIFYSHGLHHHVAKGLKTINYLKNVAHNLKQGGHYILIDEFIPNYINSRDREINIVIWYAHVIAHAIQKKYSYLAQEESKILLDDLYEGRKIINKKTPEQIALVLSYVTQINQEAEKSDILKARQLAMDFLSALEAFHNLTERGNDTLDLSRGDYKICDHVFREEIEGSGLEIIDQKPFGDLNTIGAVCVYTLKKGSE